MHKLLIHSVLISTLLLPVFAHSANWSRFITTKNNDDVLISFRQMRVNNAWSVQWKVDNESVNTVEPVLKNRHYLCDDNSTLSFTQISLGIYTPGSKKHDVIQDKKICPNSKIKLVEIETEINPIANLKVEDIKNEKIKN
jgi:hypothetical protein